MIKNNNEKWHKWLKITIKIKRIKNNDKMDTKYIINKDKE